MARTFRNSGIMDDRDFQVYREEAGKFRKARKSKRALPPLHERSDYMTRASTSAERKSFSIWR